VRGDFANLRDTASQSKWGALEQVKRPTLEYLSYPTIFGRHWHWCTT